MNNSVISTVVIPVGRSSGPVPFEHAGHKPDDQTDNKRILPAHTVGQLFREGQ